MYVKKDPRGKITAVSETEEPGFVPAGRDDSVDVELFLQKMEHHDVHASLQHSDLQMARVVEDLINILIEKNIIRFTDFPDPAQQKLMLRRELRGSFRGSDLLGDEEENIPL